MPDLTTLTALKQWDASLSASNTNADAVLSSLITATSADFLREIERTDLLTASYTEQRVGDGSPRLILRHWPITAIASVTVAGTALSPSTYYFDETLDPERTYVLYLTPGNCFTDAAPITVVYTAGYAEPPADIAQAVIEWAVLRFKKKQASGQTQMRNLEGERSDIDPAGLPPTTQRCIDLYKRKWPGYGRANTSESNGVAGTGPAGRRPMPPQGGR